MPKLALYSLSLSHFQFIFASIVVVCACARLDNTYLPPSGADQSGGNFGLAPPNQGGNFGNNNNGGGGNYGFGGQNNQGGLNNGGVPQQGGFGGSGPAQDSFAPQAPTGPSTTPIPIISYENENYGDGSYKFSYETGNGIKAQEQGEIKNKGTDNEIQSVSGSYSYTAPDGQLITVTYIADENGFQPQVRTS